MTAIEFLQQVDMLKKSISDKEQEIQYINDKIGSLSSPVSGDVPSSTRSTTPSFVRDIEKKELLQSEIQISLIRLKDLSEKIENAIDKVDDIRERKILMYRHVMCMSWKCIAEKMGYTERWVYSIHNNALVSLEKKNSVDFSTNSS